MLWCTVLYVLHPFLSLFILILSVLLIADENASLFFLFYISSIFHWCILSTCQFFHIYVYYDVCIFPFYLVFVAFFRYIGRHCLLSLCIIIILIFIFNAKVDALGMNCRHFMRCTYALYVLFIWYEMTSTEFVLCVRWHIFLILPTLSRFHRTFCQSNSLLFLSVRFALFFCVLLLLVHIVKGFTSVVLFRKIVKIIRSNDFVIVISLTTIHSQSHLKRSSLFHLFQILIEIAHMLRMVWMEWSK